MPTDTLADIPPEEFRKKFDCEKLPSYVARSLLFSAFSDFEKLHLRVIDEGKSGASVWSVTPGLNDRKKRYVPFLAKLTTSGKAEAEQKNFETAVAEIIPFRLHPPLRTERCRASGADALVVFDFIDRALSFRAALCTCTPAQLIASLFDHTLGGCRIAAVDLRGPLTSAFAKLKLLSPTDALVDAAGVARNKTSSLPDVTTIRNTLLSLPPVHHRLGVVHGDLHTGNLLVAGGSTDVLLIDFGTIQKDLPLAFDPACLEVSITFCPKRDLKELKRSAPSKDKEWLTDAYAYSLDPADLPHRSGDQQHIAEAVRAIRAEARKVESYPTAYALAAAAYLLRYASYDDDDHADLECRALAYELACRLVTDAVDDVKPNEKNRDAG